MSPPDRASPAFYALVALALILATALVMQGWHGSRASAILHTPPRKIALTPPLRARILSSGLQIIQNGALFYATRKFYRPVLATPPTSQSKLWSYHLIGTLLVPQKPGVAFLRKRTGSTTMTVSPGDRLDGWTVEAVRSGKAVFGFGDQRVTLTTTVPLGKTSTTQSAGIVRMRIAPAAHRPLPVAHVLKEPVRSARHPP